MGNPEQTTTQFVTYTDNDNIQHSIRVSDINMASFKDNVLQFQCSAPLKVPVFGKKKEFLRYTDDWPLHIVTKTEELIKFQEVFGFDMEQIETTSGVDEEVEHINL
jgi:hypothetical protein